jgi:hypothetical protein
LALALMSTVWMVPFLMFFDVTIMVAAVPLVAATTAATTAAITALFIVRPLFRRAFGARQSSVYRRVGLVPERENWPLGQLGREASARQPGERVSCHRLNQ